MTLVLRTEQADRERLEEAMRLVADPVDFGIELERADEDDLAQISRACALLAGLIGLLSLAEYAFAWNPGFDQWLFPEPPGAVGTSHPGRMAPDTAICFVLLAVGGEFSRRAGESSPALGVTVTLGALVATIGLVDLQKLRRSVPVRHRGSGKWLMNPIWDLAIRRLGTAVGYLYTTDLTGMTGQALYGKEVILSDDAPEVVTTTALDQRVAFLDFKKYYIVDAPGSFAVEYIPHMFATATNLPNGTRGLYAYWRTGADLVDSNAGRLLLDKTSA